MVYILLFPDLFVSAWYNKLHPTDRTIKKRSYQEKDHFNFATRLCSSFVRFGVHQFRGFTNIQTGVN